MCKPNRPICLWALPGQVRTQVWVLPFTVRARPLNWETLQSQCWITPLAVCEWRQISFDLFGGAPFYVNTVPIIELTLAQRTRTFGDCMLCHRLCHPVLLPICLVAATVAACAPVVNTFDDRLSIEAQRIVQAIQTRIFTQTWIKCQGAAGPSLIWPFFAVFAVLNLVFKSDHMCT